MKRVIITFKNEEVWEGIQKEILNEAREKYAENTDNCQEIFQMEEDDEEIRITLLKAEEE